MMLAADEAEHRQIERATPADILAYVMDRHDLAPDDMRPICSSANRRGP
jgi:hypothetical protein